MLFESGAAQHRLHHRVGKQIVEARPVAAAIETLVHDVPPCSSILCTINAKHDRFMSLDRKFRGISPYLRLFSRSNRAPAARSHDAHCAAENLTNRKVAAGAA